MEWNVVGYNIMILRNVKVRYNLLVHAILIEVYIKLKYIE